MNGQTGLTLQQSWSCTCKGDLLADQGQQIGLRFGPSFFGGCRINVPYRTLARTYMYNLLSPGWGGLEPKGKVGGCGCAMVLMKLDDEGVGEGEYEQAAQASAA